MAYCLPSLKEKPQKCPYIKNCEVKIFHGEYNIGDLYIRGRESNESYCLLKRKGGLNE